MPKTPMISQVSIPGTIITLIALGVFVFAGLYVSNEYGLLIGLGDYLILRLLLRLIARDHRKGIGLVRQQQFEPAIPYFLRSYEFFARRRWLDDYRSILMLSPSALSYREMALNNAGFCYSQIGDGTNARRYYEQCLSLFPESGMASAALKMMDSASSASKL